MGIVKIKGLIGRSREDLVEVEFLVDTRRVFHRSYHLNSGSNSDSLAVFGSEPQLADSSIDDVEVTVAHLRLNGREGAIQIEVLDVPEPLLGVSALEAFGMKVNPVSGALEVIWPFDAPPTISTFLPPQ